MVNCPSVAKIKVVRLIAGNVDAELVLRVTDPDTEELNTTNQYSTHMFYSRFSSVVLPMDVWRYQGIVPHGKIP